MTKKEAWSSFWTFHLKLAGQILVHPNLDEVRQDVIEWVQPAAKRRKIKGKRIEIEIKIKCDKVWQKLACFSVSKVFVRISANTWIWKIIFPVLVKMGFSQGTNWYVIDAAVPNNIWPEPEKWEKISTNYFKQVYHQALKSFGCEMKFAPFLAVTTSGNFDKGRQNCNKVKWKPDREWFHYFQLWPTTFFSSRKNFPRYRHQG